MKLRVGLLGMSDNLSTRVIVTELARLGRPVDVVFLQDPDMRGHWRRFVRKLKGAGLRATLQRIVFALKSRMRRSAAAGGGEPVPWPATLHRIRDVNSEATRSLIRGERLDLLLIVTDSMVGRGTFSIPRLGTLNAHPGWLPAYRGLGSMLRMLRDGLAPAISVHLVDEGIDTGPVILREPIDRRAAAADEEADRTCYREQGRMFAKAVSLFEAGDVTPIDTFLEPSSMARGLRASETWKIYASVRGRTADLVAMHDEARRPAYPAERETGVA